MFKYWHSFIFILGLLVITGQAAHGQDYPTIHFTVDDGLPSNTIYNIYRDTKGFMWIATDKGIARYNGVKFSVFTTFNGLPDNEILFFIEDKEERLWLGTYNGELCYYKNDTFHTAANTPFLKTKDFKAGSYIRNILVQKDSSVIIDFSVSNSFVSIKNNKLQLFGMDSFFKTEPVILYVTKQPNGGYQVLFRGMTVSIDSNCVLRSKAPNTYNSSTILYQNGYKYYILTGNLIIDEKNDTLKSIKSDLIKNEHFYNVYDDGKQIYFLTTAGLFFYDSVKIFDEKIANIIQDVKGNYWLGSLNKGVYILDKDFRHTHIYRNAFSGAVQYTHMLGGNIYFASVRGLDVLKENRVTKLVDFRTEMDRQLNSSYELASYYVDEQQKFYCFNKNNLYYIDLKDRKKHVAKRHTAAPDYLRALYTLGDSVYLCTHNQIYRLNYAAISNPEDFSSRTVITNPGRIFSTMLRTGDSSFWFSTRNDLYGVDKRGNRHRYAGVSFKAFTFLGGNLIGCTHNNQLLFCKGITRAASFDTIAKGESCIWDKFYKLDASHLLVSTNNLYRVLAANPPDSASPYSISTIENEFVPLHADAICSDSTNCYFFKDSSIIMLNIKDILGRPPPPQLRFTLVKTHKTYAITDEVKIPYEESRNIKILFSMLSFYGKRVSYQYSVSKDGQDNWTALEGEALGLSNPGYGTFVIKMRAKSSSSDYCAPIVFSLTISTPFWATWWCLLVSAFVLAAVLLFIIAVTRRLVLNASLRKHKHVELELKSIYSQLNPHFIFNSLNAAMYLVKTKRLDDAYQHIYKFSRLLRAYIKSSRNRYLQLGDEIDNLKNYIELQQERFKDKFDYEIIISPEVSTSTTIPSLLIQPLVENAISHGLLNKEGRGKLTVGFIMHDKKTLICSIDDNGIGREQARLNKDENMLKEESYGGALIKDLIGVMNKWGKIKIEMEYVDKRLPDTGTTVILKIKYL